MMLDDTRRRSLASVTQALAWTAEQTGEPVVEHALGRATPARGHAGWFEVDLGDQCWDENHHRNLLLRYADGTGQAVERVVRAGPGLLVVEVDPEASAGAGAAMLLARHDPAWLPRALARAVSEVGEVGLAGAVVDGLLDEAPSERLGRSHLNDQQRRAVATIAAPGVHAVVTPPGTGATTVIAEAAAVVAAAGRSVLVLSHSPPDVDDAAEALWQAMRPEPGSVLRLGAPHSAALAGHPSLTLARAAARRRAPLQADLERIDRYLADTGHSPVAREWEEVTARLERADSASLQAAWRRIAGTDRIHHLESELARVADLMTDKALVLQELRADGERIEGMMSLDPAVIWRRIDQAEEDDRASAGRVARLATDRDVARTARDAAAHRLDAVPTLRIVERRRAATELEQLEHDLAAATEAHRLEAAEHEERHSAHCRLLVDLRHELPGECDAEWWADLQARQASSLIAVDQADAEVDRLEQELRRLEAELDDVRSDPPTPLDYELVEKVAPSLPALRARRDELAGPHQRLLDRRDELVGQRAGIETALAGVEDQLITSASALVATPAALLASPAALARTYDVVIVDQAGATALTTLVLAASLATSGLALVGDPCRPGPSSQPRPGLHSASGEQLSDEARHWLVTEPFHHFGIRGAADAAVERGAVLLSRQYRFGKLVESLANRLVYDDALWSAPRWRNPVPDERGELILIDTSTLDRSQQWIVQDGTSRHWPLGVVLAGRVMELHAGASIGLVAPYRAQADLLRAVIADSGRRDEVAAGTVEDLQGRSFDVVVLDLVSSRWRARGLGGGAGEGALPADLRAAVASLTCTRGRAYLIGDVGARRGDDEHGFLPALRDLLGRGLAVVDALELLDDDRLVSGGAPFGHSPGEVGKLVRVHSKSSFYDRMEELAGRSRQRIDVWSPYYTERRIRTLGRRWGAAARRGRVHARVLPARTAEERTALAALERSGVVATHHDQIDERLVVVDGQTVLWGSLNVLSSNRRTELMAELDSPRLARLLRARADGYPG